MIFVTIFDEYFDEFDIRCPGKRLPDRAAWGKFRIERQEILGVKVGAIRTRSDVQTNALGSMVIVAACDGDRRTGHMTQGDDR